MCSAAAKSHWGDHKILHNGSVCANNLAKQHKLIKKSLAIIDLKKVVTSEEVSESISSPNSSKVSIIDLKVSLNLKENPILRYIEPQPRYNGGRGGHCIFKFKIINSLPCNICFVTKFWKTQKTPNTSTFHVKINNKLPSPSAICKCIKI